MTPDLLLVGLSLLTWGLGEGMFFYFNPLYLQQLGADPILIGSVLGAVGLAMTVAHIPAGYFADRIGRRPLLLISWTMGVLSGWTMALAPSLTVFIIGMVSYGLTAFVMSPLNSYVTAARGKLSPGRAMTLTSAMYNVGAIAGPLIGGMIGNNYGLEKTYLAAACVFIVSWIIMVFIRPQPRDHHDPESPPEGLFSNRRYIGFLALIFAVIFSGYLAQPLTANFLQNQRGINIGQIGQFGSINSLGIVLFSLIIGQFNPRFGFLLGQAALIGFTFLLWQGRSIYAFYAAYFLMSGFRGIRPLISAQVRELIHSSQMGLAYGILETISAIPAIIAPPIAGILYLQNPEIIYPISMVLIIISLGLSIFFGPRTQTAPESAAVIEEFPRQ
jgi:MFS family permease